eukprot:TRINITY_DN1217_c0_g1_i1.p1 TRINITY_DN1217_c0_g1~~TRINITY_DN1217_c0_g1_i1.p1  ORF type:complete len:505 (-),score=79.46 TRINITY_DN1217_c0_g1_i1:331-1845(-)
MDLLDIPGLPLAAKRQSTASMFNDSANPVPDALVGITCNFNGDLPHAADSKFVRNYSGLPILPVCMLARLLGLQKSEALINHLKANYDLEQIAPLLVLENVMKVLDHRLRRLLDLKTTDLLAVFLHIDDYHLIEPQEQLTIAKQMHDDIKSWRNNHLRGKLFVFPVFSATQPFDLDLQITNSPSNAVLVKSMDLVSALALFAFRVQKAKSSAESSAVALPALSPELLRLFHDTGPMAKWITALAAQWCQVHWQLVNQPAEILRSFLQQSIKGLFNESTALSTSLFYLIVLGIRVTTNYADEGVVYVENYRKLLSQGILGFDGRRLFLPLAHLAVMRDLEQQIKNDPCAGWCPSLTGEFMQDGKLFGRFLMQQTMLRLMYAAQHQRLSTLSLTALFSGARYGQNIFSLKVFIDIHILNAITMVEETQQWITKPKGSTTKGTSLGNGVYLHSEFDADVRPDQNAASSVCMPPARMALTDVFSSATARRRQPSYFSSKCDRQPLVRR